MEKLKVYGVRKLINNNDNTQAPAPHNQGRGARGRAVHGQEQKREKKNYCSRTLECSKLLIYNSKSMDYWGKVKEPFEIYIFEEETIF